MGKGMHTRTSHSPSNVSANRCYRGGEAYGERTSSFQKEQILLGENGFKKLDDTRFLKPVTSKGKKGQDSKLSGNTFFVLIPNYMQKLFHYTTLDKMYFASPQKHFHPSLYSRIEYRHTMNLITENCVTSMCV